MTRNGGRNVWSIELKAEERLDEQEEHGYRSGHGRT